MANLLQFYKLDSNKDLQIDNIPFLNIVYFHFNFFKIFIHSFKEKFDKGEHMFPGNCYNYYKTKDNKFVSFGNLEKKFQKNFFNVIKIMDKEKRDNKNYNYRAIQDVLSNYTRKEIQDKVNKFLT